MTVENTTTFYKKLKKYAIEINDIYLCLEAYKGFILLEGDKFASDSFLNEILEKFDLCNTMTYEELKSFVSNFSDSYYGYSAFEFIFYTFPVIGG